MEKYAFADIFIANDGCSALASWLRCLPTGQLPALELRSELLQIMTRLPISRESLLGQKPTDIKLGSVVAKLQYNPGETIANRKLAAMLVQKWLKQILSAQPDDVDDMAESQQPRPLFQRPPVETAELVAIQEKASEQRMHPAIPVVGGKCFTIQPLPRFQPIRRDKVDRESNRGKVNMVLTDLQRPNKKSWRPYAVSVAGRQVNMV